MPSKKRKKTKNKKLLRKSSQKSPKSNTAIVKAEQQVRPVIVQGNRARELRPEEIELLKRTIAKNVTDDEFAMFLWVCRKHKLDPITRQIHAIKRNVSKHHQEEVPTSDGKGKIAVWVAGEQMTIQIGIDGYRALAARSHKDYGGCDEPEFVFSGNRTAPAPAGKEIPDLCRIKLWKKGLEHPVVGVAYWDEYAPRDISKPEAFMWNKMPKHMLAKCAEALAIRKGYPDLADIYTSEEMMQANDDYTENGRLITVEGQTPPTSTVPSERLPEITPDVPATGSKQAAQEVAKKKVEEHQQRQSAIPEKQPVNTEPIDVEVAKVWPKNETAPAPPETKAPVPETKRAATPAKHVVSEEIKGIVQKINQGVTSKKAPTRQLRIDNFWFTCYSTTLHEYLDRAVGQECVFQIDERKNIVGIKRIGKREFDSDGRTPIIQNSEPRGGDLFSGGA